MALSVALLAVLAGAVVAAAILGRSGSSAPPAARPSASPTPPRVPFAFPDPVVKFSQLGSAKGRAASRKAAASIGSELSAFYEQAFFAPAAWTGRVPASAWNVFDAAVRQKARGDQASLTLGAQQAKIATLEATSASLTVRVLVDASGAPTAAIAVVQLEASGTLAGGEALTVTNRASFLLRPAGGKWEITGYPSADTEVTAPAAGTPSASPSASSGATP